MYLGPDALKESIENAELYPIRGLFNFRDYFDEIDAYYHQTLGYDTGLPTGWNNLNGLYNVRAVYFISTSYYHTKITLLYVC
jgi:twinkle protein